MVATQIDLRYGRQALIDVRVTTQQGERMAQKVGATKYVECSAKTHEGVQNVFDEAVAAAVASITGKGKRHRKCIIL